MRVERRREVLEEDEDIPEDHYRLLVIHSILMVMQQDVLLM